MKTNAKINNQLQKNKTSKIMTVLTKLAIILAVYVVMAVLVEYNLINRQFSSLIVPIGVNIILAVSLNLVTGFLGELSLGHAGFMSIGAFTGALFTLNIEMPTIPAFELEIPGIVINDKVFSIGTPEIPLSFIVAILLGGIMAAIFGFLIGVPVLRLRGDYLAIVTLAFGEIIRSVINTLYFPAGKDKTGELIVNKGTMGLSGIENYANYTWVYVAVVITIILCINLVKSRHGRVITSIRDNIIAAESIGIRTSKYKIMTFVIAAFFAGVAGVIGGHNVSIIKPGYYGYDRSIDILVYVVLGGMGSIKGSIIAATILTVLPELLRPIKDYRMLMYAVVLIAMMLFNHSNLKAKMQESGKLSSLLKFGK